MRVALDEESRLLTIALAGMAGLALALGLARFAYTPVLPMMQADQGLSLTDAGWLAIVNQLGYLLGGVTAAWFRHQPAKHTRRCLVLIGITMLAMGLTNDLSFWLLLRFVTGVASAWMMVTISMLCLSKLAPAPRLAAWVYAGVGGGTILGGLICLAFVLLQGSSSHVWIALAVFCMILAWPVWRTFDSDDDVVPSSSQVTQASSHPQKRPASQTRLWFLLVCYGLYGFGYILPATFLPAQARILLEDHWVYSTAWPVFGVAAALSTLLAARLATKVGQLPTWIGAYVLMATGILVPVVWPVLAGVLIAALCVGGTFVVITLLAMQQAQRFGGAQAGVWMARFTTAFAAGQVLGVSAVVALDGRLEPGMLLAAGVLFFSAAMVWVQHRRDQVAAVHPSHGSR
jgi:MFS family permease